MSEHFTHVQVTLHLNIPEGKLSSKVLARIGFNVAFCNLRPQGIFGDFFLSTQESTAFKLAGLLVL